MRKRVAVFPCGSEIAAEIHNSLQWSTYFELVGLSSIRDHGKYLYKNYVEGIPYVNDPYFTSKVIRICQENHVDFIIPAHDSAMVLFAKHSKEFESINCKVIASPYSTCELCRSKEKTYRFFKEIIPTPQLFAAPTEFPLFLKPDIGQGSKGTHLVNNKDEYDFWLKKDPTLLALEYLPGDEYTIDCFTDRHRVVRFCGGRLRGRTINGISANTKVVNDPLFQKYAELINTHLQLRGMWFFQLKKDQKGLLKLLEISPRLAGTMGLHRNLGVNLPLLTLFDAMDLDVSIQKQEHFLELDRSLISRFSIDLTYDTVYVDLDDTLIFQDRVNTSIVKFLYQCLNNQIKINLITRHKGNLQKTLEKYKLSNLFDEVIHVTDNTPKSQFMPSKNAIFIDDSHRERHEVYAAKQIPCFDSHSVESLMNWSH